MSAQETPRIAERVKFWEEQDRINKAIIPRILKNHDLIAELTKQVTSFSELAAQTESRIAASEKKTSSHIADCNEQLKQLQSRLDLLEESTKRQNASGKIGIYLSVSAFIASIVAVIVSVVR